MDDHFRAFSFVDQITRVEPGVRVQGRYTVPSAVDRFPPALAAEAVGQLAAWGAMATIDFTHRPLAGIAGEVELLASFGPGQQLDLVADLESVDTDSAVYSGLASLGDVPVIRLRDCVGPMVPLGDYDDPAAVRDRFNLICTSGACPGAFGGIPRLALERRGGEPGRSLQAELAIPEAAPFFADHFPRRAVFPGTLLVHANLELAQRLMAELPETTCGAAWSVRKITGVKLRTFIPPGARLAMEVKVVEQSSRELLLEVDTRNGRRTVCGAQVVLGPIHPA